MAEGRVIIGYSYPYYALYSNTGTTITYADGNDLARGVGVDFSLDTADSTNWYANNDYKIVETASYIDNLFKRQAKQYIAELNRVWNEDNENTQETQVATIVDNLSETTEKDKTTNDCNNYDDGIIYIQKPSHGKGKGRG